MCPLLLLRLLLLLALRCRVQLRTGRQSEDGVRMKSRASIDETAAGSGSRHVPALPMNQSLKRMWSCGELSSPQVQELAAGAAKQGAVGMDHLAALGASGAQKQNMFRDMCQALGTPLGATCVRYVKVPTVRGLVRHPVMMPHLLLRCIRNERPELFASALLGGHPNCSFFGNQRVAAKLRVRTRS